MYVDSKVENESVPHVAVIIVTEIFLTWPKYK